MKYVAILGGVAVLLVIFIYFSIFYVPADEVSVPTPMAEPAMKAATSSDDSVSGIGTLDSLRVLGRDMECSIVYAATAEQAEVEGTYFVSDGFMRGDFQTESPDLSGTVLTSMIMDEDMMYVWSEIGGERYGMKMSQADMAKSDSEVPGQPVPSDASVRYECEVWSQVDRSIFVPPSDVLFRDYSDLIKGGMEEAVLYEGEGM